MPTECIPDLFGFAPVEGREVVAAFDAGAVTSDAGAPLLSRPVEQSGGRHLLAAKLRPANIDGAAGSVEEVARIVAQIRCRWAHVRILVRADSGFAREELMAWCEANGVAPAAR
jgi:hypothetical protein